MDQAEVPERPLWHRIVDYPLVAMVIAIIVYALAVALSLWLGKLVPPIGKVGLAAAHTAITIAILFAAYKLVIARLGQRPKDDLPAKPALPQTAIGLGIGFALMAASVAVAAVLGVYRIDGAGDSSMLLMALITSAIMPGFTEELLFRGILFRWLEEFGGSWLALAVTSALFGLAHIFNPNATWFSSFAIAVEAGVLLGGAYMLTRSLWMPIGLHAAWNFTQGEVFDVPVSGIPVHGLVDARLAGPDLLTGGTFGLEASVIALVIATAAGVWMVVRAVRKGELVRPHWSRRDEPQPPAEAFR
ncbi:MAG: CPBP family intramembrane glutamic endopeptidase [Sphingomicrobium sp.]